MHILKYFSIISFGVFLSVCVSANSAAISVQLRGSTTLLPIAQRVAEAYMAEHPNANIVISGGGTERGYKSILDGTADIGMASGNIPEVIADQLDQQKIKINSVVVDYDAIVAVVHPSNIVSNLSIKQLKNIFSGRITNWKEVGGVSAPIEVFVGIPTGGITETWKRIILGEQETYTPAGVALATEERIRQVMEKPLGITYLTMGTLHNMKVKILNVNGVAVNKENVVNGSYSLRVPLMLITSGTPSSATQDFIHYFLSSPKATAVSEAAEKIEVLEGKKHE